MKRKEGFPGQISYVIPVAVQQLLMNNSLISDLYLTDIGYYPNAIYHYRERQKGIDQFILIYCTAGEGIVQIEKNAHELLSDQYIIIPKRVAHSYYSNSDDPWSIYWIHFGGRKSECFIQYSKQSISIEKGEKSRINSRLGLFEDIFRNLERGFGMDTMEYVNLTLNYLLSSFTHVDQFRMINSIDKDPVARSINYMLENLKSNVRVKELADLVHLSVSHYSRLFAEKTGYSAIDYFNQLKIQRACRLLDITELSITNVSQDIGFLDPFYFSRLFKKVMGISPQNYRKRNVQ